MVEIPLKTDLEIKIMTEGGQRLSKILGEILKKVKPGLSTLEIDGWIEDRIIKAGGTPSFKLVPRYHWASCIGINNEVVHSIPKEDKIIKDGDLLKVDVGMLWQGFNTDVSWTVEVRSSKFNPSTSLRARVQSSSFLEAGKRALEKAVEVAKAGNRVGHISQMISQIIEEAGYAPVRVLTGHGIGRCLHEEPLIPCWPKEKLEVTPLLKSGMTLAIEIIYNQGEPEVVLEDDGWTIVTKDGKISGLFEATIAIGENGPLLLTPINFFRVKNRGFIC